MSPGLRRVVWFTGLWLAAWFGLGGFVIVGLADPRETGVQAVLLFLGVASQLGLVLSPWSLSRGPRARVAIAVLMAPCALLLGMLVLSIVRGIGVSPAVSVGGIIIFAVYGGGAIVYSAAYAALLRAGTKSNADKAV